jgi:triosephosphate isomerase
MFAGNWKSNLTHLEAVALVQKVAFLLREQDVAASEVVVLPPYTALRSVQTVIEGERFPLGFGAQDVSEHAGGAHTGEVSGGMLAALGCSYVVVGHSERRAAGESDSQVAAKVRAAYNAEVTPVLCVGEAIEVRRAGEAIGHVTGQLRAAAGGLPAEQAARLVLAYEPVWAIGTGEVATPADAQEVCAALRATLGQAYDDDGVAAGVRILYGGSVKPDNAPELMEQADVDGALVGGASLSAEDFVRIVRHRDEIRVR